MADRLSHLKYFSRSSSLLILVTLLPSGSLLLTSASHAHHSSFGTQDVPSGFTFVPPNVDMLTDREVQLELTVSCVIQTRATRVIVVSLQGSIEQDSIVMPL